MKIRKSYFKIMAIYITIFAFVLTGCGSSSKKSAPQQQSTQTEQKSEKIPDQLVSIEDSVEKIIKELDGPSVGTKEEKKGGQQGQGAQQGQSSQQGQGGQQSQSGQQGQGGQQQGQTAQPTQKKDPWETITPIINTLHYSWNDYMPSAVKKGANRKLIDNFSDALNSLTNTIIEKNKVNTLLAANYLYAFIPDFYSLYKTETSPEIKRIRYYTRNAMLHAMTANWTQADSDLNSLKASWSLFKNTVTKDQQDDSNKLDFSISELEKVVKERNQPLTDIKGRIALSNVESLDKTSKKEEGKQSGGGGQSGGGQSGGGQSGGGQS